MKLVYEDIETHIDFAQHKVNILVIENPSLMREVIGNLVRQIQGDDGKFILSEGSKTLSLAKNASIIIDFFAVTLNERKVLTKLYDRLTELSVSEDFYLRTNDIRCRIEEYTNDILFASDLTLAYDDSFKMQEFFKFLGIKFEDNEATLLERLLAYVELCASFLGLKLVVCVNLNAFLSKDELEDLYNQIKYYNINLLLIEHKFTRSSLPQEHLLVIDEDLCEI